jgi:hypothetical protein
MRKDDLLGEIVECDWHYGPEELWPCKCGWHQVRFGIGPGKGTAMWCTACGRTRRIGPRRMTAIVRALGAQQKRQIRAGLLAKGS